MILSNLTAAQVHGRRKREHLQCLRLLVISHGGVEHLATTTDQREVVQNQPVKNEQ
jgi:hypothetical protein